MLCTKWRVPGHGPIPLGPMPRLRVVVVVVVEAGHRLVVWGLRGMVTLTWPVAFVTAANHFLSLLGCGA